MDQNELTPVKKINGRVFYKYPYLDILIAIEPSKAITDLWKLWTISIRNVKSAGTILQILVDQGRKAGVQSFLHIESSDMLPEAHRLTSAILSLDTSNGIYYTPKAPEYSFQKLRRIFDI